MIGPEYPLSIRQKSDQPAVSGKPRRALSTHRIPGCESIVSNEQGSARAVTDHGPRLIANGNGPVVRMDDFRKEELVPSRPEQPIRTPFVGAAEMGD